MPKRNRPFVTLECESCHQRNYTTNKNPKNSPDRLELMKFCPHERKVVAHRESK